MFRRLTNVYGTGLSDTEQSAAEREIRAERRQRHGQILLYLIGIGAILAVSTMIARWMPIV